MSLEKNKRCKVDKTPVFLDFDNVVEIMFKRGIKIELKDISKEVGFSTVSIGKWKKEAPEVVTMIYHFLNDNSLNFEDLIKPLMISSVTSKRCKIDKMATFLDWDSIIKILAKRGIKTTKKIISKEVGFSTVSIGQWKKEAPEVVTMIYHFLKNHYLKFDELVKPMNINRIKSKRGSIDKSHIVLDFDNTISIMANRGVLKNKKTISEDIGFSTNSIENWQKKAPEVVAMIYCFLKDNHLKFEDLVKEIKKIGYPR